MHLLRVVVFGLAALVPAVLIVEWLELGRVGGWAAIFVATVAASLGDPRAFGWR